MNDLVIKEVEKDVFNVYEHDEKEADLDVLLKSQLTLRDAINHACEIEEKYLRDYGVVFDFLPEEGK